MSQPSTDPDKQKRLNAILAEYVKRKDAGQPVSAASLLQAYPDLADGLRSYFQKESAKGDLASAQTIPPKRPPKPVPANVRETMNPGAARSDTASDFRNRTFGRYQLLRPLGEGAMGSVYLALDTTLDRQVALKMPKSDGSAGEDFMARFTREAKAAAGLKHPGICSVYDAGKHDGIPYITMDYIDGAPLSQFIGSSQLQSVDSILQMISTIADAVGHAHSNGVVHRDLKPGNIIVDSQFRPHVTDFGLARRIGPSNESRMTQEGLLIGTPAYMAPEQVKGEQSKVGRTSDIYSLGVILFELLTSRLPFEGSVPEMLAKVLRDVPPVPSRLRKDLSEDVDDLCLKMLRKDPEKRFVSMEEVVAAIAQVRKNLGKAPSRPDGTDRQRSPFEIQKAHLEEMLKRGQYAAAIQDLEKLAQEKQVGAKAVADWARTKLPGVCAEAKAMNPAGLSALLNTAQQLFEKHDYPGCIQLLEDVPSLRRTEAMEELLEKAKGKELEAEQLLSDIKDRERRQNMDGIESLVKRLLKLKPGNVYAKRLWDTLHTYSRLPSSQRRYRYEKGRLLPMAEPGFLREWGVLTALGLVVGVLVCLSVYSYATNFLNTDDERPHVEKESVLPDVVSNNQIPAPKNPGGQGKSEGGPAAPSVPVSTGEMPAFADAPFGGDVARSHQAAWATHLNTSVETSGASGIKLALIPPGRFLMGLPDGLLDSEFQSHPQHTVTLTKPFLMATTEVTQELFERVMGRNPSAFSSQGSHKDRVGNRDTWRQPVESVSWYDAIDFCNKLSDLESLPEAYELGDVQRGATGSITSATIRWERDSIGYRLPTDAEWEFACRAGTVSQYWFGDALPSDFDRYALSSKGAEGVGPDTVGKRLPNPFGLYDIYGNVCEYCFDVYAPDWYSKSPAFDPACESGDARRVVRGGSWGWWIQSSGSGIRGGGTPAVGGDGDGIRIARSIGMRPSNVVAGPNLADPTMFIGQTAGEGKELVPGIKFRWCPAGTFTMGSPKTEPDRVENEDEMAVALTRPYWIGQYEITQSEWQKVMGNTVAQQRDKVVDAPRLLGVGPNRPMYYVNYDEATEFCHKLTTQESAAGRLPIGWEYCLPTEAQWEYACRAGTSTATAFGDQLSNAVASVWAEKSLLETSDVGGFPANNWKIHDMHGNVWEWCRDAYQIKLPGGRDPEILGAKDSERVYRGGSWQYRARFARSALRSYRASPDYRDRDVGFRVVAVQRSDPSNELTPQPQSSAPMPIVPVAPSDGLAVYVGGRSGPGLQQYDLTGRELSGIRLPGEAYDVKFLENELLVVIPTGAKVLLVRENGMTEILSSREQSPTDSDYSQPMSAAFDRRTLAVFLGDNLLDELLTFPLADPSKRTKLKSIGIRSQGENFYIDVLDSGAVIVANSVVGVGIFSKHGTGPFKKISKSTIAKIAAQAATDRWAYCDYLYQSNSENADAVYIHDAEKRCCEVPWPMTPEFKDRVVGGLSFSATGRLFALMHLKDANGATYSEVQEIDIPTKTFIPRFRVPSGRTIIAVGQPLPWPVIP